jgi:hypothetical protein
VPPAPRPLSGAGRSAASPASTARLFLDKTHLSPGLKAAGAVVVLVGILAQSGGFFLHLALGQPGRPSAGTAVTTVGAALLAAGVVVLVVGPIAAR